MNVIGSAPDALALMATAALVGVVFPSLQDVNLFIWGWIRSLLLVIVDFTNATITGIIRAFLLATDFAAQIFQIFRPFTSKTLELFQRMWSSVVRNETVPIRRALEKLEELRTAALGRIAGAVSPFLKAVVEIGVRVLEPIRAHLAQAVAYTFSQSNIDVTMAGQVETRIADQARAATTGYTPIVTAENQSADWWRQIVWDKGLLQPRTVLESSAALSGTLVGMFANGGLQQDRDEDVAQLVLDFPAGSIAELVAEVVSGELLEDPAILAAVVELEELLAAAPASPRAG
jgi:hypothetical protein